MTDSSPPEDSPRPPRDKPAIKIIPPKLYGAFLAGGIILNFIIPLRPFDAWGAFFMGLFLAMGGAALAVWGFKTFKAKETSFRIDRPATCVITTGPFAFSRNPVYLAFNLIYAGVALIFNSGWALLGLGVVLYVLHRRVILKEEEYLEKKFGQAYLDYKAKVRRWI